MFRKQNGSVRFFLLCHLPQVAQQLLATVFDGTIVWRLEMQNFYTVICCGPAGCTRASRLGSSSAPAPRAARRPQLTQAVGPRAAKTMEKARWHRCTLSKRAVSKEI